MRINFNSIAILSVLFFAMTAISNPLFANDVEVAECLKGWKTHPFKADKPEYKTLAGAVKVMGIGKDIVDSEKTDKPALVYVKPSVNVMAKTVIKLLNPNGWYCIKSKVDVLAKTEFELDCKSKMAISSGDGVTVLGSEGGSDKGTGVTVLGKTTIKRLNCK
jgi:hypothetical protein